MKQLIKLSFRNIVRQAVQSVINVLGLAIGIASSLLILMYVSYEYSFDKNWVDSSNIYRITYNRYQNETLSFSSARTLRGIAPVVKEKIPGILGSTELFKDVVTVYNENNQIQDIQMFVTDSTFFSVFKLDFIDKRGENPLTDLYSSVISESAALSLFGTKDAVGKWFKVCQGWRFCVTGVYRDLPSNAHIPFDMLLTLKTYYHYFQNWDDATGTEIIKSPNAHKINQTITSWNWGYNGYYTYVLLQPRIDPRNIESEIKKIAPQYTEAIIKNDGKVEFFLQPVSSIHLNSNLEYEIKPNGDRKSVLALIFISFTILIIAWINFVNLNLVRAVGYSKSVGLRKMAGATKRQLVSYFLVEALITNLASIFIGICLVLLLKGWFSSFIGTPLMFAFSGNLLPILIAVILSGIFISGLYPALYLSSFKSTELFQGLKNSVSGSLNLRKILVVMQFAASIFLISGVFIVKRQIDYMKTRDLGVNIDRTLVTFSPPTMIGRPQRMSKIGSYKSMIRKTSDVESVATSSIIPGKEILWTRQDIRKADDLPNTMKTYAYAYIDYDFIKTFNLEILSGRNYTEEENEKSKYVIINEMAMHKLGFQTADAALHSFVMVGKDPFEIIGVVRNYHHESLKKEIKPIVFFYGYKWMSDIGYYSIKINTADIKSTVSQIETIWKETYPEDRFNYFFLDDAFNEQYKSDQSFGKVFTLFTLLAIIIANIGLFGLAVYTSRQRIKEIGVRRVNGAPVWCIIYLLNRDFVKWVVVAFAVAVPIASYVMSKWLENFAYRTDLAWWIFILAGLLALGIALLTVSWQSWKAATRNPIEALRYE